MRNNQKTLNTISDFNVLTDPTTPRLNGLSAVAGSAPDSLLIQAIKVASHSDTEPPQTWIEFAVKFREANRFLPNYRDTNHKAAYAWFCDGYQCAKQNT